MPPRAHVNWLACEVLIPMRPEPITVVVVCNEHFKLATAFATLLVKLCDFAEPFKLLAALFTFHVVKRHFITSSSLQILPLHVQSQLDSLESSLDDRLLGCLEQGDHLLPLGMVVSQLLLQLPLLVAVVSPGW